MTDSCLRCRHTQDAHGGDKDCMCGECMWFVSPSEAAESALTEARAEVERMRDEVCGFKSMRWPEEAHRLQQQRNAARAEVERLEGALADNERAYVKCNAERDNARRAAKESALNGVAEQRRAESAEAALASEREAHAGLRARLEALADAWERDAAEPGGHSLLVQAYRGLARNLRATLAAPVAAEEGGEQEAGEGTHQRPGCTCGGISACLVCQEADEQEVGEAKVTWHRLVEVISSTLGCDIQAWQDRVTGEWDANCETCGANADEDGCLNAQRLATAVDRLLHTAPSGSDEQGDRPATPDANGVHDTKGGDGR